jgi:protein CMS1
MTRQGGDDLDDFGDELVVSSAEEEGGSQWDHVEDVQVLMSPDEDAEGKDEGVAAREKKRKRREKDKERKAKVGLGLTRYSC